MITTKGSAVVAATTTTERQYQYCIFFCFIRYPEVQKAAGIDRSPLSVDEASFCCVLLHLGVCGRLVSRQDNRAACLFRIHPGLFEMKAGLIRINR